MNTYRIVVRETAYTQRAFIVSAHTIEQAIDKSKYEMCEFLELRFGQTVEPEVLLAEKLDGETLK